MTLSDKVIWSQGMFLHPQHLQQQERYLESLMLERSNIINHYAWGISKLKIDEQLLPLGKLALKSCCGIFPDGTLFNIPGRDKAPPPIDIPLGTQNCVIYLALTCKRAGVGEAGLPEGDLYPYRYQSETLEVSDSNAESQLIAPLQVAKLSMRLLLESQDQQGYTCIGLLRVLEARRDHIELDEHYLAPCLNIHALPEFSALISEAQELLRYRSNKLSELLTQGIQGHIHEMPDVMLLQIINRYEPLLKHFSHLPSLHPEQLFQCFIQLVGEMATYARRQRHPVVISNYLHNDLQTTFESLMTELRYSLSLVLEESVVALQIEKQESNTWVAVLNDKSLLHKSNFILAVYASIPPENLHKQFPAQVKAAPVEAIRNLVSRALPGIELNLLAVVPRQIPYYVNFSYFSLNHHHTLWEQIKHSAGLAFHVSGIFPDLRLELWAVKDKYDE